uniref:Amino acid permease/ SLC12A domain-containing protein n=1 Tax=Octopus bimaculoides TaxID=37653 RepID=A0A0L8I9U8_OCTBM
MAENTVQPERKLGLLSGIALIVGTMIGSGIFISPKGVLEASRSVGLTMIIWLGCGVIAMLSSLSYVELGTFITKSGGEFSYIMTGLPAVLAFLYSWCSVIVLRPSGLAVICLAFAEYVASPVFDSCGPPVVFVKCLAAAAIIVITAINCYSTELAASIQVIFTVAKIIALIIIIIGGFVMMGRGNYKQKFCLLLFSCLLNLPLAIIIGIPLVTILYLLTNVSYLAVMTKRELLESATVGGLWGDRVLGVAAIIIPISVAMSTFGAANGSCFTSGR